MPKSKSLQAFVGPPGRWARSRDDSEVEPATTTLSDTIPNPPAPATPSYTILRIKRKRNEEPLDALVVESRIRRKKSRGGVGVFQYAQTVEDSAWDDATQKSIQDEISRLARETAVKVAAEAKGAIPPAAAEVPPLPFRESQRKKLRHVDILSSKQMSRSPRLPPKVYSTKELEARKNARDFKMYDAIRQSETPMAVDESSEMDKFLPMLNDYLNLHDEKMRSPAPSSGPKKPASSELKASDNDYVWDVFYHRPATSTEWNAVANVGTVTGLPPSFGDGYDSTSDSEEEFDEADEDSNAEEYYKNDYPEEEDSDEWHENSEYDDVMGYPNEQEQFDWR
ncbi:hypothetical protein BJ912DRAFT_923745 [Pholiota molesta]|nr:hypothetical protein BJ912DRAFT_923745 [Pholiota molesta]